MSRPSVIKDPTLPGFPHGETKGYRRGCRCDGCVKAMRARKAQTDYLNDSGRRLTLPAEDIRAHVNALLAEEDVDIPKIARASGLSQQAIRHLLNGGTQRTQAKIALPLLAVTADKAREEVLLVDSKPYQDMLRRLQAHGYSMASQAVMLGEHHTEPHAMRSPRIHRRSADKVEALYARLSEQPMGPDTRSAATARRHGYHAPACYDENGEYIPGSSPWQEKRDARPARPPETLADLTLRFTEAVLLGTHTRKGASKAFDISRDTVQRWANRIGLDLSPLAERLSGPTDVDHVVLEGLARLHQGEPPMEVRTWIEAEVGHRGAEESAAA